MSIIKFERLEDLIFDKIVICFNIDIMKILKDLLQNVRYVLIILINSIESVS